MNNRGNFNIGEEVRNIVQDAVNNRDFNRLNRDIGNAVNGALDEVRRSFGGNQNNHTRDCHTGGNFKWKVNIDQPNQDKASQTGRAERNRQEHERKSQASGTQNSTGNSYRDNNRNNYNRNYNYNYNYNNTVRSDKTSAYRSKYEQNKPVPQPKFFVPVGRVSAALFSVFGTIGSITSVIAAIVLVVMGYLTIGGGVNIVIALALLLGLITSISLSVNGSRIHKRLIRFQRYLSQMHGRNYCLIKDFSSATGRSDKYTVKDLQKMIEIGMFPEGHIDDKRTCFMLNSESYEQYLKLQENMRMRDMEEQTKNKEQTQHQEQTQSNQNNQKDTLDPAIKKTVEEGRQYVQKIRNANIAIPGEEISRKLDRLEEVTGKIFDHIETHPDKLPEIKKFTEYFLPTTLKLLDAYRELEYQPVEGENISTAKKEIEDTMDTINTAFENLLDGLFEEAAMDISTDISVLHTMFAQEGLTEKNGKL